MFIDNRELFIEFSKLGDNVLIHILLLCVVFDVLSGIAKAIKNQKLNSDFGLNGMVRHILIVLLILVITPYMELLGYHEACIAIVVFIVAQYGISILENLGELGIAYPEWIKNKLLVLVEKKDEEEK